MHQMPDRKRLHDGAGSSQRRWRRLVPSAARPCGVQCAGLGDGVPTRQTPLDVSLGGCALRWTKTPPRVGARLTVGLSMSGGAVTLPAVVAHVRTGGVGSVDGVPFGDFGVRILPGAPLEAATVPLGAYLISVLDLFEPALKTEGSLSVAEAG